MYLLRFIEPMNLINKKDSFPFEKALFILSLFYNISHIICLGICCGQCHKPYAVFLAVVGYDVSQGSLEKKTHTQFEKLARKLLVGRRFFPSNLWILKDALRYGCVVNYYSVFWNVKERSRRYTHSEASKLTLKLILNFSALNSFLGDSKDLWNPNEEWLS